VAVRHDLVVIPCQLLVQQLRLRCLWSRRTSATRCSARLADTSQFAKGVDTGLPGWLSPSTGGQHLPKMQVSSGDSDGEAPVEIGKFDRPVGNSVGNMRLACLRTRQLSTRGNVPRQHALRLPQKTSAVNSWERSTSACAWLTPSQAFVLSAYLTPPRATPELCHSPCSERHPVVIDVESPESSKKVPPCGSLKVWVGSQTVHNTTEHAVNHLPFHNMLLGFTREH